MKKRATIHDIAIELKITSSTVSRALSDHPAISAATKLAVREMAAKLNYRQNKIASSLRSGRTHIIGVIIPSAELHFFGSVVHAIEQVMNLNGYSVLLYQTNESYENEKKGIEAFLQLHVDGIIASLSLDTSEYHHFGEITRRNIPLVLFDRTTDELTVPSVKIDDYRGGYLAAEHLISQGYRRIGHITAKTQIKIFRDRLEGYKQALKDHDLPWGDELVSYGEVSIESGASCMEQLLALPEPPDAVFAIEDFTAMGAMQKAKARGFRVPEDFGVIGFANEAFSAYITPALSTVDQQTRKMGQAACQLLLDLVRGQQPASSQIVLDPELVKRESTNRS